jgi:LacI family transcriptional regulator
MALKKTARPKPKVTLKDVARRAGVSAMTISNVINNRSAKVSVRTRQRVEATIARLGYRPDPAGRSLRLSRQFLVEMIIVDPSPTFVADAFTTSILAGLSNCLNRRDYGLILRGTSFEHLSQSSALRSRQTDALCVMASGLPRQRLEIYQQLAKLDDPFVIFQDGVPAEIDDAASVMQDDAGGGALLANHLIARGCTRFVWVSQRHPWPAFEKREAAVKKALRSLGSRASLRSVEADSGDYTAVQQAVASHVARDGVPDAFLCGNDQIGIAVVNWLVDKGHRIPEDVRVTGFNAFDFWRYSRPVLTTIESPAYALGELGGTMLIERLRTGRFEKRETVLPVQLRLGAS